MTTLRTAALLSLSLFAAGCSTLPKPDGAKAGPFFTPANVTASQTLPTNVRRVLVLPVAGGPALAEETLIKLEAACLTELTRTGRFEVVPLTRKALAEIAGVRQVNSVDPLPPVLLDKLFNVYNPYGADAVLFTDVTTYAAYPPLALGLRSKLVVVATGEVIWAADNVFSAATPAVANSARRHVLTLGEDRGRTNLSHSILQNPARFSEYVAAATFATLPAR